MAVDIDISFIADVNEPIARNGIAPDIMFRINDRTRIFDFSDNYQLSFDFPRLDAWSLVPAGYLYAASTDLGRQCAAIVAQEASFLLGRFNQSGRTNWWIDQNVLFRAHHRIRSEVSAAKLENIADYGLPYKWRRPEGAQLRNPLSPTHPIYRRAAPSPAGWASRILTAVFGRWWR